MKQPLNWKKILTRTCWVLTGIGMVVLFGASLQQKQQKLCKDISIQISGVEKHLFIDEKDVMDLLNTNGSAIGKPISSLNLRQLEQMVEQNKWVKNAEMFFDNNQLLQVTIEERQPIARVFLTDGASYYLDTAAIWLPLSNKISARVPVFTGIPVQKKVDTALIQEIISIAKYVSVDSFFAAQIAQIDITPDKKFELVPVIGDQIIRFGDASDLENKFKKLAAFYKTAWLQNGMNTYEILDVQYKNQVVGIRRGTSKAFADSAAALSLIKNIALFPPALDSVLAKPKDTIAVKATIKTKPTPTIKKAKTPKMLMPKNNKKNQKPLRT
ncbi:MAG: FtsQ-type POTRA domain-containing protein [Sediminibacterium sp.]|nr:FtsQ-type POTRA domain-containing protein [Sediminibacterium sp.]TXT34931.1 MAG: hypothetical protein FD136_39 [Chitinophagaceae bacterium]